MDAKIDSELAVIIILEAKTQRSSEYQGFSYPPIAEAEVVQHFEYIEALAEHSINNKSI